ncbi:DEAD/DEAH box helicase [Caldithrix abyssi]
MNNNMTFSDFALSTHVLEAIDRKGFEKPTDIQALTIPMMLDNDANLIAQAQTGTGKTAAFGLPLIEKIDPSTRSVQALILVPTRELAIQVADEIDSLKGEKNLKIVPIYGGQSIETQLRKLKQGIHIVVGTPGRVIDHINRKTLKLDRIEQLILDEADEMLNMGFIEDMEEIMQHTNPDKRTLLFSATIPPRIKDLARKYMDGYEMITAKKEQLMPSLTEQIFYEVRVSEKFRALCRIIDFEDHFYGLIFCKTRKDAASLAEDLLERGYSAEAIHGEISQGQRERNLNRFKSRKVNILVATDVAARGIDVNDISHVINYALPQDPESYVHRIGRTGRAGKQGVAVTFVTPGETRKFQFIQQIAGRKIKKARLPRAQDIINAKRNKISEQLQNISDSKIDKHYLEWAQELLKDNDPAEVLAAVLQFSFQKELNPKNFADVADPDSPRTKSKKNGNARLFIALGRTDQLTPKKLIKLITSKSDIKARQISDVKVKDNFSFITVPFDRAMKIISSFKDNGSRSLVTFAKD